MTTTDTATVAERCPDFSIDDAVAMLRDRATPRLVMIGVLHGLARMLVDSGEETLALVEFFIEAAGDADHDVARAANKLLCEHVVPQVAGPQASLTREWENVCAETRLAVARLVAYFGGLEKPWARLSEKGRENVVAFLFAVRYARRLAVRHPASDPDAQVLRMARLDEVDHAACLRAYVRLINPGRLVERRLLDALPVVARDWAGIELAWPHYGELPTSELQRQLDDWWPRQGGEAEARGFLLQNADAFWADMATLRMYCEREMGKDEKDSAFGSDALYRLALMAQRVREEILDHTDD